MAVSDWLRPPRHLVVLFLGIALVLVSTLAWLGWRLFQQDRALEEQRVQVRLEHAADVVAAQLTSTLRSIEERLASLSVLPDSELSDSASELAAGLSHDVVVLAFSGDEVEAFPRGRLIYYPVVRHMGAPNARAFARGEALEFRQRDLTAAAQTYRRLTQSPDSLIRAGALMRLARTQRNAGRFAEALATYEELAALAGTVVEGRPAELVARHARLGVLETLSRSAELQAEALALREDLQNGRWYLTRAQYEFYNTDVCRHIDCGQSAAGARVSSQSVLAAASDWLWGRQGAIQATGHELTRFDEQPALIVWHRREDRMISLAGGPIHLTEDWIGSLASTLDELNVEVSFSDVSGDDITPPNDTDSPLTVTRSVADTRLPWTMHVASADPLADFAQLGERRRLMLLGLVVLALFVAVGLFAVLRGVSRELEAARLQSDFVAAVSHEFRTPLTSLRQLAELLSSDRVASDDRRRQYYGIMERESGRLHRLVEGLLDFGRMEAGALEFRWESVAPNRLVRSVVTEFEAELGESGYQIEFAEPESVPAVRADAEALGRAVWNLLDNAVKYSPDHKTIHVSVSTDNEHVAIAVRDEGVGIPPDERATVFKKFVRGSSASGRGTKGTGIGLAMVRHIVSAHGGEVQVESQVGQGSTFTILLPVEE